MRNAYCADDRVSMTTSNVFMIFGALTIVPGGTRSQSRGRTLAPILEMSSRLVESVRRNHEEKEPTDSVVRVVCRWLFCSAGNAVDLQTWSRRIWCRDPGEA